MSTRRESDRHFLTIDKRFQLSGSASKAVSQPIVVVAEGVSP